MNEINGYDTYRGLAPLAGLCTMQRAVDGQWSLDESVDRLKRLHYVLKRLHEILTARITSEPIYELKTAYSYHAYLFAEQVSLVRRRVGEMREPPLGLDKVPHVGLQRLLDDVAAAPRAVELVAGAYHVVLPAVLEACERLRRDAHPVADAPTARVAKLVQFELDELVAFGEHTLASLCDDTTRQSLAPWIAHLNACLESAGALDGTLAESDSSSSTNSSSSTDTASGVPPAWVWATPFRYDREPQRDERFQDSFNAGVNPEAFLYDESFSARDKTLMMYYKRIRELDVPEMMASILVDLQSEEPWDFHMEMSRQLWDEARHAMMGEIGFVAQGIDWRRIPINYTWSRNLNLQLTARERHGVLFFIEQGLMPKTGKRYEWEVAVQSGDPLSALFQDFDWADEVLHAQIGRRWYVPRYESLNEALRYGDECWSKVLSHWREYLDKGWTEHRNWWPEVYAQACRNWGQQPDPRALAFSETYENKRADLEQLP